MRNDQWEVIVQDNIGGWNARIWLINKGYKPSIGYIKEGVLELQEIIGGKEMEPSLILNQDLWRALKKTMTENYERDKSTVEAELGATKYHLEDMRKLVFRTKDSKNNSTNLKKADE